MKPQVGDPENGFLGYLPPEVGAILLADAVPHQDTTGGAHQVLTALAGGEGGFAVAWRDPRDGSTGLYLARLDHDLVPREPERSASKPHTMRRTDPAVSIAPDGALAITWTGVIGQGSIPFLRLFDAEGRVKTEELWASAPVGLEPGQEQRGSGDDAPASCRLPDVLSPAPDRTVMAWVKNGRVQWLDIAKDTDFNVRPVGAALDVDPNGATALPGVRLCASSDGAVACLWSAAKKGVMISVRRGAGFATRAVGDGIGDEIVADADGGYWVLARVESGSVLRRVSKDLRVVGADVPVASGAVANQDLGAFPGGLAVLVTSAAAAGKGGRGGDAPAESKPVTRLHVFDADGARHAAFGAAGVDPLPTTATSAQGVRLASDGRRLLVAWTDVRTGEGDVYGRLIDPSASGDARFLPERRLNTDVASSDQVHPAVAAAGDTAVVTWVDRRGTPARVYARRLNRTGFQGDELALPLPHGENGAAALAGGVNRPAVAVRANGDALVAWRTSEGRGKGRIVGQIVRTDGQARSGLLVFDDGGDGELLDVAVIALPGERGFLAVWPRAGAKGVHARRVSPAGEMQGLVRRVSEASDRIESDVAAALLDDGRVIVAWNSEVPGGVISIHGRILKDTGEGASDEIRFEHARPVSDWDPALAAAEGGGFVMAWTSGARTDPVRDVVVRAFDSIGRPRHTIVTPCWSANEQDFADVCRLENGTFAVAWEDDVSYADQCYVRRLSADGKRIGRMLRLNAAETVHMPDRVAPRMARFGDGFVTVFGDRRRGQGFDVRVKIVGAAWDVGLPPDPPAQDPPR